MKKIVLLFSFLMGCGKKTPPESNANLSDSNANEAVILGALDKAEIDRVISEDIEGIKYCYQQQLAVDNALAGKVVYKIVIAKDGSVSKVSVKESSLSSEPAKECISQRLSSLTFPAPKGGGIVIVSYPFVFSKGE